MNGFYQHIRDRLPSLWRPDDDPGGGEMLPLAAADIATVGGAVLPPGRRKDAHNAVVIERADDSPITSITTTRPLPPGSLLLLYPLDENGQPYSLPRRAVPVQGAQAAWETPWTEQRFALRMRRPDLLTRWLRAVGDELGAVHNGAGEVQQGHWFAHADHAVTHPWVHRWHEIEDTTPPRKPDLETRTFPYLLDLARIGGLLNVAPWIDPPGLKDTVETYRLRLGRMVALYRQGLGTVGALRRMCEAQLPTDQAQPEPLRDRALAIEERVSLDAHALDATTRAQPQGVLGPLMRWHSNNSEAETCRQTLIIASAADGGAIVETVDPVIECERIGSEPLRLGLGVRISLAASEALRCSPRAVSILAGAGGLRQARHASDPAAPGPWSAIADTPAGSIQALAQTIDRWLYVAVESAPDTAALWRWNGLAWEEMASGLPRIHCLFSAHERLEIGSADGLIHFSPPGAGAPVQIDTEAGSAVFTLIEHEGERWRGTAEGLERWDGAIWQPHHLHASNGFSAEVYAIHIDAGGNLYAGGDFGLVQWQKRSDQWFLLGATASNDDDPDWIALADDFPDDADNGLPAVYAILRSSDESLWIGTAAGLARYHAQCHRNTYTTLLTGYPQLGTGTVHQLSVDERDGLWSVGDDGLYRFDGRDWWQVQGEGLVRLGVVPRPRDGTDPVLMHYDRSTAAWHYHDPAAVDEWLPVPESDFATAQAPERCLLWADGVLVERGAWDGSTFTPTGEVPASDLIMRWKPDETEIRDGGLPALPRMPVGNATWRYLRLESEPVRPARDDLPAWTCEGRLLAASGTLADPDPTLVFASEAPWPGRFETIATEPGSAWSRVAFAYAPTARIHQQWQGRGALSVMVRLRRRPGEDSIHPVVIERVWQGLKRVQPIGIRLGLAVDERIVRPEES